MSKKRTKQKAKPRRGQPPHAAIVAPEHVYELACERAERGDFAEARRWYEQLAPTVHEPHLKALIHNDRAAIAAVTGDLPAARSEFGTALVLDEGCALARDNLLFLEAHASLAIPPATALETATAVKVAILSFLFNWPSTGGGIVHTVELAQFLIKAGYDVKHFYARQPSWGVGKVEKPPPFPSVALDFEERDWNVPTIQARFREAVEKFDPDNVIITDSWNMKPLLAEAARGYPTILRLQAMECLCPLNNVRLLADGPGKFRQCSLNQLANPDACMTCLRANGRCSGGLHQAERALCGVGTVSYQESLRRAFAEAEAVLVVNPLTEALVRPFARDVRVVTAGMAPARFPAPNITTPSLGLTRLLFAGLIEETMKGFAVLHEACALLWQKRQDFELVATGDPPGQVDAFTRFIGWQSQEELPKHLSEVDVLMVPTVAQEALGRTAVEAMAAGKPVIASRLGGLPYTVIDGETGLLCAPGNVADLARKIEMLLNDPELRQRLGMAGRKRFEEHFSWEVIIDRHYKPLLKKRNKSPSIPAVYTPFIPAYVNEERLLDTASRFFELPRSLLEAKLRDYRALHEAKEYTRRLGERKTLCFEEAFLLYVLMGQRRPARLVEIGTQHGKSTRRLLDMVQALGLATQVTCYDVVNCVEHFTPEEARLIVRDLTGRFQDEVLRTIEPEIIFLDTHAHALLREVIVQTLAHPGRCVLAIHDCGKGLCNPRMAIARDDPEVTSGTGVWQRHVLGERFGIDSPLSDRLDWLETPTHRHCIFETPHGLAVIVPKDKDAPR